MPNRPTTTSPWAASSTTSATAPYGRHPQSLSRKTTRRTGLITLTGTAARATSSARMPRQYGPTDHTYYTQVNMTRTIEQILGLPPMNQFDLVASPMRTDFVKRKEEANFQPFNHLPNQVPLDQGVTTAKTVASGAASRLAKAWTKAKARIFAGKSTKPDAEDPDTVNHLNWYEATGFTRPYPGEVRVRLPSDFKNRLENPEPEAGD